MVDQCHLTGLGAKEMDNMAAGPEDRTDNPRDWQALLWWTTEGEIVLESVDRICTISRSSRRLSLDGMPTA